MVHKYFMRTPILADSIFSGVLDKYLFLSKIIINLPILINTAGHGLV